MPVNRGFESVTKANEEVNKGGRPTKYTNKIGDEICERIACGESVNSICRDEHIPHKSTVMRWLLSDSDTYTKFRDQYALARQIQYEFLADEIIDVADDGRNDYMDRLDPDGNVEGYQVNGEAIARSRLRVDTRKWFLSKVLPKFSDKKDDAKPSDTLPDVISKLIDKLPN